CVQRTKELFRAALYLKRDHAVVRHHNRAGIQVMRRYRRNDKARRLRKNHRSAAAQRITGGSRRCTHDQSVGKVGVQEFSVEIGVYLDHGRRILAMQGEFIQRKRRSVKKWYA